VLATHPDVPAERVGTTVRHEWGVDVSTAEPVSVGSRGWNWALGDGAGRQWYATVDIVRTSEERRTRLASYEAALEVGRRLSFAVTPVPTRDARLAVDLAPGLLLTLTPYLDGRPADSPRYVDDEQRSTVARMLGELHRQPRPRRLPAWRPSIGPPSSSRRQDLERCLDSEEWEGGPWSGPAGRLVHQHQGAVRKALRRFTLLAAAVTGNADRWVLTHGASRPANVVGTPDGPRLLDWGTTALGPRERDLGEVLGDAEGPEPWFAYVEAGGRPDKLSPDTVELFALQRHLSLIADHAVQFARPHDDTEDDRRAFGELEEELSALVERWT
jgi:aminoglycoside phosphotransferase (APT) family kinase protein